MNVFTKAAEAGARQEASGHSLKGRVNVYACTPPIPGHSTMKSGCLHWIVTIDREAGVTPMFVKCGHCGGTASSRMYKVGDGLEPTHEWFRPTSADQMPEGYSVEGVAYHLENGGLLLRPIGDGKWIRPTPEIRAFAAREQEMYRAPVRSGG